MANLDGTPGNDVLTGTGGPDTLRGLAGNDRLVGGGGDDRLEGGTGDDTYYVDAAGDIVIEASGEGTDIIFASASYVLRGGVQVERLAAADSSATTAINLTGNELANIIYGNAGANVLVGRGGADLLIGLGGDDRYYIDDAAASVRETAGGGSDVVFASTSYTLGAGVEVEILSAVSASATTAMTLAGNALANTIYGNAGANVLIGRGGADLLIGLGGDDRYYIDDAAASVREAGGGGSDVVFASTSYTLTANSEVEILSAVSASATTAMTLSGNALANTIYGNAGANVLIGRGGADLLIGLGGDDRYYIDDAAASVREAGDGGSDVVFASTSYTLTANSEVEILSAVSASATTAINLTGNAFANTLYGNAGVNVLDGGLGKDLLIGLGGNDMFAFATALGAGNIDTVRDFVAGSDRIVLGGAAGQPFSILASGALAAGAFVIGSAALDADDYLIYNSATGALLYDADGDGATGAVQFATLSTGLSLSAADFVVTGPANHAPAVTSGGTANVTENSPTTTIVYQAVATDADGDRITFSLGGADAGKLTIDANGAVRLRASPDFEARPAYNFTVIASDSGSSTVRAVVLNVGDVNDTAATPIINEKLSSNDSTSTAQAIDRSALVIATNASLPNDSLPSATIQGDVSGNLDKDFFSVTLQAGEKLVLDVDGTTGGLDSFLQVFGPNGVEILDNDDQGTFDPGSQGITDTHNTDSFISFRAATAGTYYFSIGSFESGSSGSYKINVSIGPPATPAEIIEEDIQALISGEQWPTPNITYSFPNSASDYPQGFGVGRDEGPEPASFLAFTGAQQAVVQTLLPYIAGLTDLTFQQLFDPNDGAAKLRYAMTSATGAAHAYYPGNYDEAGSLWFNKTNFNSPLKGNYAWMGILHETGHALGLKHGHEAPAISSDRDSVEYSVMTYRSYPGQDISDGGGYTNETWGYAQTLMMYDIAALQRMYGADYSSNSGDSIYTWSRTTGEMSINGAGQGAPGGNRVFMTIWDGGGIDTYDLSNYSDSMDIDLRPGEWLVLDRLTQAQRANLGEGHFARGNVANALLHDGDPRSLVENAIGGSGSDAIWANQAKNSLTGNGGTDIFIWSSIENSGLGTQADIVTDFVRGQDKIDLSLIDAIPGGGNNSFSFIEASAFHGVAGELRYQVEGNNVRIQGDIDGNGVADLEVLIQNHTIVAASDFII